jgi:hypothetical protein
VEGLRKTTKFVRVAAVPRANFLFPSTSIPRGAAMHYMMIPVK